MEAWADGLLNWPGRACVWGGCGALLCLDGGRCRYTSLFFPFLQISAARDADEVFAHVGGAASALASRPPSVHPAIWSTAQGLLLEVAMRTVNFGALMELAFGGAVSCSALWLVDRPSDLKAVGGLYPAMRQVRGAATRALRRVGGSLAVAPLQLQGAAPEGYRLVEAVGQQVALHGTARLFFQFDWIVAVVVNAVLGAELLQRSGREALPQVLSKSRGCALTWDGCCLAVSSWGLARQLRVASRTARPHARLIGAAGALPASWKKAWRGAMVKLDRALLLSDD